MKLDLIPDASDYGFIHPIAKTRLRLVAATAVSLGLTYGFGFWTTDFIFNTSTSVVLNMFVITANIIVLLASSYITSVLAGDLLFPEGWRREVILKPEIEDERFALNDYNTEFFFLFLGLVIANGVGLNAATANAFHRYNSYGFFKVRLRSGNPETRIRTLEKLGKPLSPRLDKYQPLEEAVLERLEDSNSKVVRRAMWLLGKRGVRRAVSQLQKPLENAPDATIRRQAAVALGRIEKETSDSLDLDDYLANQLDKDPPMKVKIGLIRGLGLIATESIIEPIAPYVTPDNPELTINALWAIRKTQLPRARKIVRSLLTSELSKPLQCATYDALKWVGAKQDILWAKKKFQKFDKNDACKKKAFKEGPKTEHILIFGDSFRVKCLKIVANTDPYSHKSWINRLARDPRETDAIKRVANAVLRQMDRTR